MSFAGVLIIKFRTDCVLFENISLSRLAEAQVKSLEVIMVFSVKVF
jgi:hypothetical protein